MNRSFDRSPLLHAALALGALAAGATAQESVIFSLTSAGTAGFGALEDTEIAIYDAAAGVTRPWLMAASAAFYAGDVDGDGKSDVWKDVDALYVEESGGRVTEVLLSFNTSFGPFLDGDIVRLTPTGSLELAHSEATLVSVFALADGGMDLDGLHVGPDGRIYVSFADDESSGAVSTDTTGVITDGSIVWWDPVNQVVGLEITEGTADALVSNALGRTVRIGDTLGIAMDRNGVISFSVQSPSSDDASVFSEANGGEYVRKESELGLIGAAEIDALHLTTEPAGFLAPRATPRIIPANVATTVDLDGTPAVRSFVLLLSLTRGDTERFPFYGFGGLALDPADPLLRLALAGLPWLYGTTDAAGHAAVVFPPAPPGVTLTVLAQPYDFDAFACGTPIALEFEG